MLQKIIHKLLRRRHYWRDIGFEELSELYATSVLRSLAVNVVGIFIPIYLYKLGYDLRQIFLVFMMYFAVRIIMDIVGGYLVDEIGPKHTIAFSTLLQIVFLCLLLTLKDLGWPLILIALFWASSFSTYFVAFNSDFSKVEHKDRGGAEMSYVYIFERLGGVIGPIIGGLLATYYDVRYTIVVSIILFTASLIPFLFSPEPLPVHKRMSLRGLPLNAEKNNLLALAVFGFENTASTMVWPLLLAVTIFTTSTYAKLGFLMSGAMFLTMILVYLMGKMIDRKHGLKLFKIGVLINAAVHFARPFVVNLFGAISISLLNDPVTVSYRMPLLKGYYDAADSMKGLRIAYIAVAESLASFFRLCFWTLLWAMTYFVSPVSAMRWIFIIVSVLSLLMLREKFKALRV